MAGGGVKINNISVVGGANGKTPTFALGENISQTSGHLYNSYDNGLNWYDLGQIKGADGVDGEDGTNGTNGVDGATPLFKIQNGYLYNSYDGGETWESLGYVRGNDGADGAGTNPNLLINSNFAINQRGQSSYTGTQKYCFDRWVLAGNAVTVNTTNKTMVTTAAWNGILQYIENWEILKGKTITASIKASSGANGIRFGLKNRNTDLKFVDGLINTTGILTLTFTIPNDASYSDLNVAIYNKGAETTTLDWVKLEIGDTATGYTPPLIAEELPKCQRYCQVLKSIGEANTLGTGVLRNANLGRISIPLAVSMRTSPTLTVNQTVTIFNPANNATYTPSGTKSVFTINNNFIVLQIQHSSNMGTAGNYILLNGNTTDDYILLDAEIY